MRRSVPTEPLGEAPGTGPQSCTFFFVPEEFFDPPAEKLDVPVRNEKSGLSI
jgi:hypothetical protein